MDKRTIILLSAILILLVAGMFGYAYLKKSELAEEKAPLDTSLQNDEIMYPNINRIDSRHYFIDGVHTFVGEIILPTPCDLLESNSSLIDNDPKQIIINFNVINTSTNCAQQETVQRFSTSIEADQGAMVSASFTGREVSLNLTPAGEGERPEEFELFIKG